MSGRGSGSGRGISGEYGDGLSGTMGKIYRNEVQIPCLGMDKSVTLIERYIDLKGRTDTDLSFGADMTAMILGYL